MEQDQRPEPGTPELFIAECQEQLVRVETDLEDAQRLLTQWEYDQPRQIADFLREQTTKLLNRQEVER